MMEQDESARASISAEQKDRFAIFPAIDIMEGKCVRLYQGDFDDETVYNKDPLFVARKLEMDGARNLHLVDLDGARYGLAKNLELIRGIVKNISLYVQVGGGIRDMHTAEQILDCGVNRIILGSAIVKNPKFVEEALKHFGPDRIVCGIDCRDGYLAVNGWIENSDAKATEIVKEFKEKHGLKHVIYTDINRDGTLRGPNIQQLTEFIDATGVNTISSGGISNIDDIKSLINLVHKDYPVSGVIVGKALYARKIVPSTLFNLTV